MKISIIIAIYNSHRAVVRQVKHFNKMNLSDDIEFIFVDDGSNPPLNATNYNLKNLHIYATNDKRPWTQGLARNLGAKMAQGEYLFMTDIDHILSREAIDYVYNFIGSKVKFPRHFGVLLEDGSLSQELEILKEYGLDMSRVTPKRGLYASIHMNTFAIKKSIFEKLGGYNPKYCTYGHYAGPKKGEDCYFDRSWGRYATANSLEVERGPKIYIFPIAKYTANEDSNPKGLFHNLTHEQTPQPTKE